MNLLLLSFIIILSPLNRTDLIMDYQAMPGTVQLKGDKDTYIQLRKFTRNGTEYLLIASSRDLVTKIIAVKDVNQQISTQRVMRQKLDSTAYSAAIKKGQQRRSNLQNAGIIGLGKTVPGIHITADLCPSQLPLDHDLFNSLIEYHRLNGEGPLPVALAVSGQWIEKHQKDLMWLCSLERADLLEITWMNHSYSHRYDKSLELRGNYFLLPGTNVEEEIFRTEKIMIMNGITPSVFIRFPGLVSDCAVYDRITNLGLIPVGSKAWLAKAERPVRGSIVLVHANGNEPEGIALLQKFLQRQMKLPREERFVFLNLRKSIVQYAESYPDDGNGKRIKP